MKRLSVCVILLCCCLSFLSAQQIRFIRVDYGTDSITIIDSLIVSNKASVGCRLGGIDTMIQKCGSHASILGLANYEFQEDGVDSLRLLQASVAMDSLKLLRSPHREIRTRLIVRPFTMDSVRVPVLERWSLHNE